MVYTQKKLSVTEVKKLYESDISAEFQKYGRE